MQTRFRTRAVELVAGSCCSAGDNSLLVELLPVGLAARTGGRTARPQASLGIRLPRRTGHAIIESRRIGAARPAGDPAGVSQPCSAISRCASTAHFAEISIAHCKDNYCVALVVGLLVDLRIFRAVRTLSASL